MPLQKTRQYRAAWALAEKLAVVVRVCMVLYLFSE